MDIKNYTIRFWDHIAKIGMLDFPYSTEKFLLTIGERGVAIFR